MLMGWRLALSKLFIIPQRYVLAIMALLAMANSYTMRVCLNIAITQMVKKTAAMEGDAHYDPNACPDQTISTGVSNATDEYLFRDDEPIYFEWSEATQGLLLSAFYYGFVLTHVPGGMLAERFGGKWVLGLGLLSSAVCTFITPVTVRYGGATALFILRVIEGLGESTLEQWRTVFWVCLVILVFTNIVYVIFAKAEQEWWDDVNIHGYPNNWKHGPLATRSKDMEEQKKEEDKETKEKQ